MKIVQLHVYDQNPDLITRFETSCDARSVVEVSPSDIFANSHMPIFYLPTSDTTNSPADRKEEVEEEEEEEEVDDDSDEKEEVWSIGDKSSVCEIALHICYCVVK
jgi:hypothetical protein